MSWHKDGPAGGRRGYHHGNLREALIKAALDLISEKGPAGFTFAEAARAAGVSPAAPYRHFTTTTEISLNWWCCVACCKAPPAKALSSLTLAS